MVLVWAFLLLSFSARLALGRPTCVVGESYIAPEFLPCNAELGCCANDQVTGYTSFNGNPALVHTLSSPGDLCPEDYPQPCCCTEEEYSAPPPIGNCYAYSQSYEYKGVTCGTGQYKLCCNENDAAVPPTSIRAACSTDWSYPCCCDVANISSPSPAGVSQPLPVTKPASPAPDLTQYAPAPGPALTLGLALAAAPAPASKLASEQANIAFTYFE